MTKIDIYNQIKTEDKTIDLKENLLEFFNKLLKKAEIKDRSKLDKIAKIRSRIEIELRNF
jgi:metal-responsive CopG/Arc/MetJ family transcriptional regulator